MSSGLIDPDGDSQMQSSGSDSDQMFPDEAGPSTPQNYSYHLTHSTLSPPGSQGPRTAADNDVMMETSDGPAVSAAAAGGKGKGALGSNENQDAPGWGWKNPKAQDEYERALSSILDKDFSLREFGELLDERDVVKATGLKH